MDKEVVSVTLPKWKERITAQLRLRTRAAMTSHIGDPMKLAIQAQQLATFDALLVAMEAVAKEVEHQGDIMAKGTQKHIRDHVSRVKQTFQVPDHIRAD